MAARRRHKTKEVVIVLHPRHRGNCADFFVTPQQTARMEFDSPRTVIWEIEQAAARSGRTWNTQLTYVLGLFLGYHPADFDDQRSIEDWRTLMSPCNFRCNEAEDWSPFTLMWRAKPQGGMTA
jgi:hypothetical protein